MTKKIKPNNKDLKPYKAKNDLHTAIIDEYYSNGFNKVKSALTASPGITYRGAQALANSVLKDKENETYIKYKHEQLKAETNISTTQILKELLTFAYSDVTQFLGLTLDEIKALPPEVRRCLTNVKIKRQTYKDRQGKEVVEENIEFKLVDKLNAIDKINKYIGFYEVDNKQKANNVNLTNISTDKLNVLLELHNQLKE